jgi:hypothetical protein
MISPPVGALSASICYPTSSVIIQKVIKGIGGIDVAAVQLIFQQGILCNWWRNSPNGTLPRIRVPEKLTSRNLDWHQNSYDQPDSLEGYQPFRLNTPFISTTAGTVERDVANRTNTLTPAWRAALYFATDAWKQDGWLFHCHLFLIGKRAPAMEGFAEELRELNIYTGFSPYQPEGEITAKIVIPAAQIERADLWSLSAVQKAVSNNILPGPVNSVPNSNFVRPENYNNLRSFLL